MGGRNAGCMAIVSNCASAEEVLVVRKRPHAVNGGGFVVTDCSQRVVFRVDGCGVVGKQGHLILVDSVAHPLLLIRRLKRGMAQAFSVYRKWKGYEFEGSKKLVFSLKEPKYSRLVKKSAIRMCVEPRISSKDWDFEVRGYFPDRDCSIVDYLGSIVAQIYGKIGMKKEVNEVRTSKDLYLVVVKPGIDQAFVIGVISILDYIYGESTRCRSPYQLVN